MHLNIIIYYSYIYRIDSEDNLCVSDFGLSKSLYEKMYFRQGVDDAVKLPLKWMALESMHDNIFSEKSDVVKREIRFLILLR